MVTMAEVARAAGVSPSAVSKALLGGGGKTTKVSEEKIRRIRETAERLGYRPNLLAQKLASKRNDIIGVIIDSQCCGLYNNIMAEIESLAFEAKLRIQVGLVHDNFDAIRKYVDDLLGYGIEDVICFAHYYEFAEQIPPLFQPFKKPLFISKPMTSEPFSYISPDYYGTFLQAMRYLLQTGHRRILFAKTAYATIDAQLREQAYRDACAEVGLVPDDALIDRRPLGEINTPELMKTFLESALPLAPDALILGNPVAITWCIRLLGERGIRVPQDISIIGMDQWNGCDSMIPSVTVMYNDYRTIAERAIAYFHKNDESAPETQVRELIPGRLLFGESCMDRTVQ